MKPSPHQNLIVTGAGSTPLDALVQQLWSAGVGNNQVRAVIDAVPGPEWKDAETYWVLPSLSRAKLLIPHHPRRAASAALWRYRALRPTKAKMARSLLGGLAGAGFPLARHRLSVQVRADAEDATVAHLLPLANIKSRLASASLVAALGVRLSDNRKPTLQLFTDDGTPVGYAKLAWDETSREYVDNEIAALKAVGKESSMTKAPRLLATGSASGYPYLVTEPLPSDVRAVRGRVRPPSAEEMLALCPIVRKDKLTNTAHFSNLCERLRSLPQGTADDALVKGANNLMGTLVRRAALVAVSSRWHGDLVPWNTARDSTGQLWCWDWETSELDAAAGLDILHWMFSVRRERARDASTLSDHLMLAYVDAKQYLREAGLAPNSWFDLLGVYALVVAERALLLAGRSGDWSASWISQDQLIRLVDDAQRQLDNS